MFWTLDAGIDARNADERGERGATPATAAGPAAENPGVPAAKEHAMPGSRPAIVVGAILCALFVTGCGIHIPTDPDGTLDHVEGGVLRAGISPNDGWVEVGGTEPSGTEVEALADFAASLDADVEWTVGSEESLVRGLENGDLDVVAGGLTDKTPWTNKAGTTRPWAETTLDDGKTAKLVMLVPLGENAFLSRLETFLTEEAQRKGIAP